MFDPLQQTERSAGFIGPLLSPTPLVPYSDSDEEDVQVLQTPPTPTSSMRKRRRRMLREPLDVAFLRCSARLNQEEGYINEASAVAALANPSIYLGHTSAPAAAEVPPYLSIDNIQGMDSGFLQMQTGAVSAPALLELDEDEVSPNV